MMLQALWLGLAADAATTGTIGAISGVNRLDMPAAADVRLSTIGLNVLNIRLGAPGDICLFLCVIELAVSKSMTPDR